MKRSPRALIAGALTIGLVCTGVSTANATTAAQTGQSETATTAVNQAQQGKSLFKALYFGVGPAVAHVKQQLDDPSYKSFVKSSSARPNQAKAARVMVTSIEKDQPTFFKGYYADLTSGDVLKVDSAMTKAQHAFNKVIKQHTVSRDQQKKTLNNKNTAPGKKQVPQVAAPIFILAAVVWDAAAAVNYGVVVDVGALAAEVAAVWAKVKFWGVAAGGQDRLKTENTVASFTRALAA